MPVLTPGGCSGSVLNEASPGFVLERDNNDVFSIPLKHFFLSPVCSLRLFTSFSLMCLYSPMQLDGMFHKSRGFISHVHLEKSP